MMDAIPGQYVDVVAGEPSVSNVLLQDVPRYRQPSEDEKNRWLSK